MTEDLLDAYWNQIEHPDLVGRTCSSCHKEHLNDPLISPAWCPECMDLYIEQGN